MNYATTELEAVNMMLESIGHPPVTAVDAGSSSLSGRALRLLYFVCRQVQELRLNCNTVEDEELSPDINGNIQLPPNTFYVRPMFASEPVAAVDNLLYDKLDNTFIFDESRRVTYSFFREFDDLPEPVRQYITIRAIRMWADREISSEKIHMFTDKDEQKAYKTMAATELSSKRKTIFDNAISTRAAYRRSQIRGWR